MKKMILGAVIATSRVRSLSKLISVLNLLMQMQSPGSALNRDQSW